MTIGQITVGDSGCGPAVHEEECEVIREALEMRGYAWEAEQIKAYIEK